MKDHGASLQWPTPPRALRQTSAKFQVHQQENIMDVKSFKEGWTSVSTITSFPKENEFKKNSFRLQNMSTNIQMLSHYLRNKFHPDCFSPLEFTMRYSILYSTILYILAPSDGYWPQAMFIRWRAYQVIKRIPPEDRDLYRRKLLAWELLGTTICRYKIIHLDDQRLSQLSSLGTIGLD